MGDRVIHNQTVSIEHRAKRSGQLYVEARVDVQTDAGTYRGELNKPVRGVLINTTRKDDDKPRAALNRGDVTDDLTAEILDGVKQLVSEFPGYYLNDPPTDVNLSPSPADVQITSAKVYERHDVKRIQTDH